MIDGGLLEISDDNVAQSLGTDKKVEWIILRAPLGNNFIARIGGSSVTKDKGYPLIPGKAIKISNTNLSEVHVNGRSGDKFPYSYNPLEKKVDADALASRVLLEQLLKELKNMNIQLSSITDEELEVNNNVN